MEKEQPQPQKSFFNYFQPPSVTNNETNDIPTQKGNINSTSTEDKSLWVPDDQADTCFICCKRFTWFLRRHHCRICGNVFCKDCYKKFTNNNCGIGGSEEEKEIKVCAYCQEMYNKLNSILSESLKETKDSQGRKIYETKWNNYVRNDKEINENNIKLLGIPKDGSDIIYDKKLNEIYLMFVKKTIESVLKTTTTYPNLYDTWGQLITELITEAINNVSSSYQDWNDELDINKYIKIKTIVYHDQSLSRVIDGYAFQKNVCSKKMRIDIDNPNILLLNCGLEGKRNSAIQMDNILTQEPAYLEILRKKIESAQPQVILVNQSTSHKFQEDFEQDKMNISWITNVKYNSLLKIARCTKSFVLPSADLINKQTIWGKCAKFKVEKIKSNLCNSNSNSNNNGNNIFWKNTEYNLMIFEGCDKWWYCTIILSGKDKGELKELKKLMKSTILQTVRDWYLQKFILKSFNVDIFQVRDNEDKPKDKDDKGDNTVTTAPPQSLSKDFSFGFDIQLINECSRSLDLVQLSMINGRNTNLYNISESFYKQNREWTIGNSNQNRVSFWSNLNNPTTSFCDNSNMSMVNLKDSPTKENEILKRVLNPCDRPWEIMMKYYSCDNKEDKPWGQLIIDLCLQKDEKCPSCQDIFFNHSYFLYRENGRIKVSMLSKSQDYSEAIVNYLQKEEIKNNYNENHPEGYFHNNLDKLEIYSYGYCEICKTVVTPLIKLPKEVFNFSASKFYKHVLFNHGIINYYRKENYNIKSIFKHSCDHFIYSEISRIFVSKIGSIKFGFDNIIKYVFDESSLNSNNDWIETHNQKLLQAVWLDAKTTSSEILGSLKGIFLLHIANIENLTDDEEWVKIIQKIMNVIQTSWTFINELFKIIEQWFPGKFDNILKANVSIKILYLKIVQIKIINNMVTQIIYKIKNVVFIERIKDWYIQKKNVEKNAIASKENKEKELQESACLHQSSNGDSHMKDNNEVVETVQDTTVNSKEEAAEIGNQDLNISIKKNKTLSQSTHPNNVLATPAQPEKSKWQVSLTLNPQHSFTSIQELQKSIDEEIALKIQDDSELQHELYLIDSNEMYKKILNCLDFYDNNHTKYTVDVNKGDICSLIAFLLTSNQYLDCITSKTKLHLHEISRTAKRKSCKSEDDMELYKTTLWFDQDSISYNADKIDEEKVRQQLETDLLSDENKNFTYPIISDFKSLIHSLFTDTKNKNDNSNEIKINYTEMWYQYKETKDELEGLKKQMKGIKKEALTEILNIEGVDWKTKVKFIKIKYIEETKEPTDGYIVAYYPKQFEALRILYCTSYEDFVLSIAKSQEWSNVSGGKSKANFFRTNDNKYIIKCIGKQEFKMFLESGFHYFHHSNKYLFHKMPSAMSKTLGAFKIKLKTPKKSTTFCIIMENLFYNIQDLDKNTYRAYDLKGSKVNRYIAGKDRYPGRVLQDTNFMEDFNGEPIVLDKKMYTLFSTAMQNDALILSKMTVIDYSWLLILVDEIEKDSNDTIKIKVGIIDYYRKYTWDKQWETVGKTFMYKVSPTIINPGNYKKRFINKICNYFIGI